MSRQTIIKIILVGLLAICAGAFAATLHKALAQEDRTVCRVQEELAARGLYTEPVDCIWGQYTEKAVRRFQRREGLPVTGYVGELTLQALFPVERPAVRSPAADEYLPAPRDRSRGPRCLDEIVEVRGNIGVGEWLSSLSGITAWKTQVGGKYGTQYVEWKNAQDKQIDCDPACSKCTVRKECVVRARPCRD